MGPAAISWTHHASCNTRPRHLAKGRKNASSGAPPSRPLRQRSLGQLLNQSSCRLLYAEAIVDVLVPRRIVAPCAMRQGPDDVASARQTLPRAGLDQRLQQPLDALEVGSKPPDFGEVAFGNDVDVVAAETAPASRAQQLANGGEGEAKSQSAVGQDDALHLLRRIEAKAAVGAARPGKETEALVRLERFDVDSASVGKNGDRKRWKRSHVSPPEFITTRSCPPRRCRTSCRFAAANNRIGCSPR